MKRFSLALALIVAGSAALAQSPPTGTPPGPGAGNPPTGWSGGATPPHSDTGKIHPDAKGQPAAPATATAPPSMPDDKITSESQARKAIEAEGFTRVSDLKKDPDGMSWSGRATRGTSNVAVRIDRRGNISAE